MKFVSKAALKILTFAGLIGLSVETNLRTLPRELEVEEVEGESLVPKILHSFVLGRPREEYQMEYAKHTGKVAISTGFKHMLWTNWHSDRIAEIVNKSIPGTLRTWYYVKSDPTKLQLMTDYMTLLALYRYGGIAHDNDLIACGSLDFMSDSPANLGNVSFPFYIGRSRTIDPMMYSAPPKHDFIKLAIEAVNSMEEDIKEETSLRTARFSLMGKTADMYFTQKGIDIPELRLLAYRDNDEVEGKIVKDNTRIWDLVIGDIQFGDARFFRTDTFHIPFETEKNPHCYSDPAKIGPYLEFFCKNKNYGHSIKNNFAENCAFSIEELEAMPLA